VSLQNIFKIVKDGGHADSHDWSLFVPDRTIANFALNSCSEEFRTIAEALRIEKNESQCA
jgi:hypothetical protein